MIGPVICCIALRAASLGGSSGSSSITRSTFSTTTMASSTTMPTASTSPNSDRLFSEKPSEARTLNAPISDTGIAITGISDARQVCRNTITTATTSRIATRMVLTTSCTDWEMNSVGS